MTHKNYRKMWDKVFYTLSWWLDDDCYGESNLPEGLKRKTVKRIYELMQEVEKEEDERVRAKNEG